MTKQVSVTITGTDAELALLFAFLAGARSVEVAAGTIGETLDALREIEVDETDPQNDADAVAYNEAAKTDAKKAAAAKKRKANDAKRKAAAKAKEKAEEMALMGETPDDEVTLDDMKGAVSDAIERADLDQVKAVFKEHKVSKISDIKPAQYESVKTAVEAL